MKLTHRKMFLDDIPKVLKLKLRKEDQEELHAASGLTPEAALQVAVLHSDEVSVLLLDGRIVGLFGLAADPRDPHCAAPWMLSGDSLFSGPGLRTLFSRGSRDVVRKMCEKYYRLENYVSKENKIAIRWLGWLGFEFDDAPVTLADPKVEFLRFWKGGSPCAT
jgi:hypothetical protein